MYIKFQDLIIRKKSIEISKEVYVLSNDCSFGKDRGFKDQIRKSAVSIASNIAEGNGRASLSQYIYFLIIARGSCSELYTQIYIAGKIGYIESKQQKELLTKTLYLGKQISAFITKLKKQQS